MTRRIVQLLAMAMSVALLSAGCGAADEVAGAAGSASSSTIDLPSALTGGADGCSSDAIISVGLYGDDTCAAGTETATVAVDTTDSCVAWPGGGSISNAVCYRDRVCLTHVSGDACATGTPTAVAAAASCEREHRRAQADRPCARRGRGSRRLR